MLVVVTAILFFVAGCGPGQPFEIEGLHTPQSATPTHVVAARWVKGVLQPEGLMGRGNLPRDSCTSSKGMMPLQAYSAGATAAKSADEKYGLLQGGGVVPHRPVRRLSVYKHLLRHFFRRQRKETWVIPELGAYIYLAKLTVFESHMTVTIALTII